MHLWYTWDMSMTEPHTQPPLAGIGSIVYYARRGNVIKIGFTESPGARFTAFVPDEILAFEPGSGREERMRHKQFWHLRCRGEYFRLEPELLEHTRQLRQIHGDPDPSWPTSATLETSPKDARRGHYWCSQHSQPRELCGAQKRHSQPLRCSDELYAQVEAAAAALGMNRNAGVEMALREFVGTYGYTALSP